MKWTMRYYLGQFLKQEEELWKLVDLLSDTKMLVFLCEDLTTKGYANEAKAVAIFKNIED